MISVWRELRQRNVFRVAVTYVIIAAAVGGAADVFLPNLGAPAWALSSVLVLLILGLPLAAVLAWAYELTPEGVKRTAVADPLAGIDALPGASVPASVHSAEAEPDASGEAWTPDSRAIAVLPFTNMSEDPANEYFSDGVTEDILTHLSQIADLHVISRTSVMLYKKSTASVGQIARELRVGTVLEGSVRKAGERVRVTAQLIEAHTDRHLWAETYDRNLDDIFAVQSDVAQQIAEALQARLAPAVLSHIRARPSHDMKAYELFVRGRQDAYSVRPDRIPRALAQLEEAVTRDPAFAPAHAMLGFTHLIAGYWGGATPTDAFRQAKAAAEKAVSLDERAALGWAVLGVMRAHLDYDWSAGTNEIRHSVEIGPSDEDAHFWLGFLLLLQERFGEALECYERACALDPHNPVMASHRAAAKWLLGGEMEAEYSFQQIAADHPTVADVLAMHSVPLSRNGRWLDFAEANRRGADITGGHPIFRARQALGLQRGGRPAEAERLVDEVRARGEDKLSSGIRLVLALVEDDQEGAGRFLDQAIEERQPMILWYRVMGILPREEPWVRARFQRIWPEA
ncbi:MAG: tetratricopeptide repeat protein [Gemmatimonadota bacterium]